ncbi:MAG TPA: glycosyltransferase family 4 protein [Myxococcales bacterium]|nr:glycosyltransferase family 4 protein [Myxococcales bacterium]
MSEHARPLEIGFAPWMNAGVRTQWDNMLPHVLARPGIRAHVVEITPYKPGALWERLPFVPAAIKGNVRSMASAGGLLRERLDVVWTQEVRSLLPYLATRARWERTPVVFTTDSTSLLEASFGEGQYAKAPAGTLRARVRDGLDALLMRATVLNPWSEWCAKSLRDEYGIAAERIHVIPPGIDLARWKLAQRVQDGPTRILFVGGDFRRKGGDLLLSAFRGSLSGHCELHVVTRDDVPVPAGVFVYRDLTPNDPRLRDLYARAHVFVLPTRADCFSLASLEAMATGLPVITTRVGGIPEIVDHGRSGFLVDPGDEQGLLRALRDLVESPELRARMGALGRRIVEERFDAARTTARLLDLLESLARRVGPPR